MTKPLPKRRPPVTPFVPRSPHMRINLLPRDFQPPLQIDGQKLKCRDCPYTGEELNVLNYPEGHVFLCRLCLVRAERIHEMISPKVKTIGGTLLARNTQPEHTFRFGFGHISHEAP